MKKLIFLGIGSALIFTMGGVGTASADNGPHRSTAATAAGDVMINTATGAGRCAACHRTHTAKAAMLLKEAQPALCYSCHGGAAGSNTDVQNGVDSNANLALRGGGFEYALIGSDAASKHMEPPVAPSTRWSTSLQTVPVGASEATTSSHQVDGVTSGTMWGNGAISAAVNVGKADVTLECGSCHDPHGNGNYRILKPVPVDAGDPLVAFDVGQGLLSPGPAGVTIPDATVYKYTTANYWDVADRSVPLVKGSATLPLATEADGYITNVSQWCSTCHTRYLAKAPAYETDSGDAVFTYRHTSQRIDKAGKSRPNCIQCHVSHGSNATMSQSSIGLNPGDTPARSAGTQKGAMGADSRLLRVDQRGTCVMCHNM